jgi:cell wall-associated NlpC family hydrolase
MTTRADVVAQARTCLGVRFRHQGRTPEQGLDCAGLLVYVMRTLGLTVHDCLNYSHYPDHQVLTELLHEHLIPVSLHEVQPGDVLRFVAGRDPVHLGLATDIGVIHAAAPHRKVVEHILAPSPSLRLVEAYKIPGVY